MNYFSHSEKGKTWSKHKYLYKEEKNGKTRYIYTQDYKPGDPDFDEDNYADENRLGDTDYFMFERPDGTQVILEEDMKWVIPKDQKMSREELTKRVEASDASLAARRKAGLKYDYQFFRKSIEGYLNKQVSDLSPKSSGKSMMHGFGGYVMYEYYLTKDELYHHGIKGQHWGERRYQNEDGSLTAEGRERYGYGPARAKYEAQKMIYKSAKKDALAANLDAYAYNNRHPISKITNRNVAKKLNEKRIKAATYTRASKEAKELAKNAKEEYKNSDEYKSRKEKIKKAAIIGVAAAGTALAAYGGYKLYKLQKEKKENFERGKAAVERAKWVYSKNDPAQVKSRTSALTGKTYYITKNKYGENLQKGSAKNFNEFRKIVNAEHDLAAKVKSNAIRDANKEYKTRFIG